MRYPRAIRVSTGGGGGGLGEGFTFHRIDTIRVRPAEGAGAVPNTLVVRDSVPRNPVMVSLGASGVVEGSVYEPVVIFRAPDAGARSIALAAETGNDDLLLILEGGGHVVDVTVSHTRGSRGRNLAVQGDRTDQLKVTVVGKAQVRTVDRVVRFQNPSERRRFTFVRVRFPGPGGASYQITYTNVELIGVNARPRRPVTGRGARPIRGQSTPKGPLAIEGFQNRLRTRHPAPSGPEMARRAGA